MKLIQILRQRVILAKNGDQNKLKTENFTLRQK